MSASLVGSEMCIRDRPSVGCSPLQRRLGSRLPEGPARRPPTRVAAPAVAGGSKRWRMARRTGH
eukprot:3707876-Alexandrium_andersonii.AAC.1